MKMVDAGALLEAEDPNLCAVHESFTAMVEVRATRRARPCVREACRRHVVEAVAGCALPPPAAPARFPASASSVLSRPHQQTAALHARQMREKKAVELEYFLLNVAVGSLNAAGAAAGAAAAAAAGGSGGGGRSLGTLNPPHPGGGSQMCSFPRANREGDVPTNAELGAHLARMAAQGKSFVEQITDFHVLLFLSSILDINSDVKQICASVAAQAEIEEGFELIITSMAA